MISRILRVKLTQPLLTALTSTTKSRLADAIGISRPKLNAILKADWDYVTRESIERVADFLNLAVTDVFEFEVVPFWDSFLETKRCAFLRGSSDDTFSERRELHIPYFDSQATNTIERFLREHGPIVTDTPYVDHLRDEAEIIARAREENCIVIGSPQTNAATEILLSRFFGAEPFNPTASNRRKIPFGFCWPYDNKNAQQSALTCSELASQQLGERPGIAMQGREFKVDFRPEMEFKNWETRKGLDCGIVFVANRPFDTRTNVKLIVLAGLHGIGTLAAASAFIEDFRYLEPSANENCVFGVVEGHYSKQKNSFDRRYLGFSWRFRQGGGNPIL